ncbi:prepilin-type N-terminal cleavage/methylation domain-containing protein [Candidatus Gracilibacteria bacterium]|nr:prepilin-type N-terminal cleavage/methylation domain-containing protein [Candidatus Gracilibacteria bacterium]
MCKKLLQIRNNGFTMMEILLVVAAIGILAGIVIVAINPGKQLGNTKDAQRSSNVNTILNAVYQYSIDNKGNLPTSITVTATEICSTGTSAVTCSANGLINLSELTDNEEYIVSIPMDPDGETIVNGTGYTIAKTAHGRVVVSAPKTYNTEDISVTR